MRAALLIPCVWVAACVAPAQKTVEVVPVADEQAFRAGRPSPGARSELRAPVAEVATLPNGLTVMAVPNSDLPAVSVRLVFRVGASEDPQGREGLASLMADLLDAGTATRDADALAREVELLGTTLEVGLAGEAVALQASTLSSNLEPLLELLADVVEGSTFPEPVFERYQQERIRLLEREQGSPSRRAWSELSRLLYGAHPYGHSARGSIESVRAITQPELIEFHRRVLRPEHAALIVAGDVEMKSLLERVRSHFGDWLRGDEPLPPIPTAPVATSPDILLVARAGAQGSQLLLGQVTVSQSHPDYLALLLANAIFGGRYDSRLSERLSQLTALGVASSIDFRRSNGTFAVSAAVRADQTATTLGAIVEELERMRCEGVSKDELARARDEFARSLPAYFQTRSAVVGALSTLFVYELPFDYYAGLPEALSAIEPEDVKRAVNAHLRPEALEVVVIGDRAMVEMPLRALGFGEVEVLEDS